MANRYTITLKELASSTTQLRWNIDTTSSQSALSLINNRIEICGWLLAETERSSYLAIKNDYATYSYPFNVQRPDVVTTILQQPADNHPALRCGFRVSVPFSPMITIGMESEGLITWLTELSFSPA